MVKYSKKMLFLISDIIILNFAMYLSLILRFDGNIDESYLSIFINTITILTFEKIIVYYFFGLYKSIWRYASIEEVLKIILATLSGSLISFLIGVFSNQSFPRSVYFIAWMITAIGIGSTRIGYRVLRRINVIIKHGTYFLKPNSLTRVLIIGAGSAGSMVIKEIINDRECEYIPVAVLDDDKSKQGMRIHNIPVLGDVEKIKSVVDELKIEEIIIALPSVGSKRLAEIIKMSRNTKCKLKILPKLYGLIDEKVTVNNLREVNIEDLLGREEIVLNTEEVADYLKNETVLVTGGGGSIGSELCRQISGFEPRKLIILDNYENSAYEIEQELKRKYPKLDLEVVIASVREMDRLKEVFNKYRPGVVFHAAAHKHVPLMESNPAEAIKNNVLGTFKIAKCADDFGVKRFVLISTDKAVNPTNIMGATKRVAEMTIQAANKISKTEFVAVRFGNVLGSNGSVIPLFKRQIAEGGPVTVTHREVTRYFMTICEASRLVIQAGAMAKGGEIFVLDMGEPIRIADLAEDMIKLSGFEPGVDMKIEFTGLRPGEKLYEELLLSEEGMRTTQKQGIFIAKPLDISMKELKLCIDELERNMNFVEELKQTMAKIVPTYSYIRAIEEVAAEKDDSEKLRAVG